MDYRFRKHEMVRVVDSNSRYFNCCGMVELRDICQSHQAPMYQLFGSTWFGEHQLERESWFADKHEPEVA
jgi:hypothetical protein